MHHIFSRKNLVLFSLCILILTSTDVFGQFRAKDNRNFMEFQDKNYYFGMAFGTNFSNFKVGQSKHFIGNDSILIAEGKQKGGFNLHMIMNLKMGEYFDFRFLPGFAFSYRSFIYNQLDGIKENKIESVFFETPFSIRYKSVPYKDMRFFALAGLKYSYDVSSNSKTRQANSLVKISPHDFQWEVGMGLQIFYPFFIFSPEIKFSRGLNNILIYNDKINQAKVLQNVTSEVFTISFNFEG